MLIASASLQKINELKKKLRSQFEKKDLGKASGILGIDIIRDKNKGHLFLSQRNYLEKVLSRYGMNQAKSVVTPISSMFKLSLTKGPKNKKEEVKMKDIPYANVVGSLMYSMVCTRPDITHALSLVSRFMSKPGPQHWQCVKWLMRYIKGSVNRRIEYKNQQNQKDKHIGYTDSDFGGCLDSKRSTSGYVFTLYGSYQLEILSSNMVTTPTTEAEYVAATEAVKEALWLKGFTGELLGKEKIEVLIYCDNQIALSLMGNPTYHERTKHIDIKLHQGGYSLWKG